MTVRLYITSLSNPSYAAVGMLAHKPTAATSKARCGSRRRSMS
jgi:hypothetical protein